MQPLNWLIPFKIMCDASDYTIGTVMGKQRDTNPYVVYYIIKTLNDTQTNFTTTEKEHLTVVFAFDKICSYILRSYEVVFIYNLTLNYLLSKKDMKPRLIRWILSRVQT